MLPSIVADESASDHRWLQISHVCRYYVSQTLAGSYSGGKDQTESENPKTLAAKGKKQNWLTVGNDLQRQQERGQTAGSGLGCGKERWLTVGCGDDDVTHLPTSKPLCVGCIKSRVWRSHSSQYSGHPLIRHHDYQRNGPFP